MTDTLSLFDQPTVRTTDPAPAVEASELTRPGRRELQERIKSCVRFRGPLTAFQIADLIVNQYGDRWQKDTIRAEVSRCGFVQYPGGKTPRGRNCCRYGFPDPLVRVNGEYL